MQQNNYWKKLFFIMFKMSKCLSELENVPSFFFGGIVRFDSKKKNSRATNSCKK